MFFPSFLALGCVILTSSATYMDTFDQEINLIRTLDDEMIKKIDLIYEIVREQQNSQESEMQKENQRLTGELSNVRNQLREAELRCQQKSTNESIRILQAISTLGGRNDTCECVSKNLASVKKELLKSSEQTRGFLINETALLGDQLLEVKTKLSEVTSKIKQVEENSRTTTTTAAPTTTTTTAAPTTTTTAAPTTTTQMIVTQPPKTTVDPCIQIRRHFRGIDRSKVVKGAYGTYYYSNAGMVWNRAITFCQRSGMNLASLESALKINDITNLIEKNDIYGVWLSAINKERLSDEFRWADGTAVDASLWADKQPSTYADVDRACVWLSGEGQLADYDCTVKNRPLCKIPQVAAKCF